jgi:outer membrane protein assembly factor BamD (BamD/ComL family)
VARFYQKKKYKESSLRRWEGLLKDYSDISPTEEGKKLLDEAQRNIEKLRKDIES